MTQYTRGQLKHECKKCFKGFRTKKSLEEHDQEHMPYWSGRAIRVSGADQITIMLKHWSGSWKKYLKGSLKPRHEEDIIRAKRIEEFEKKHKIRFLVKCGDVVGYRRLEDGN